MLPALAPSPNAAKTRHATPVLQFLGGAGTVTGSKHLVETADARVLVDCGLFQGPRTLRDLNWATLPVDASEVDAVVLTHAHLDHVGYLPVLVRNGFRGAIYATDATARLAAIVLADSGRLQEEQAEYSARKTFSRHHPPRPLYTEEEAAEAAARIRAVRMGDRIDVARGITGVWRRAGHILGSATIELDTSAGRRILFSGDLGRQAHPLLEAPEPAAGADIVVIESTYGDRAHEDEQASLERLATSLTETIARNGVVVIPSFAVDRTEVVLYQLGRLMAAGAIPQVPVYLDSPMARQVLTVYREAIANADPELRIASLSRDPFAALGHLHEARTVGESRALNSVSSAVIIASSGMATGGRVLHHLVRRLPDARNTVVLVGYQSPGTRGHQLASGAPAIKMLGQYVPVKAHVLEVGGFSVHADALELVAWLGSAPSEPVITYVVHGEPQSAKALRDRLGAELSRFAVVPHLNERVLM